MIWIFENNTIVNIENNQFIYLFKSKSTTFDLSKTSKLQTETIVTPRNLTSRSHAYESSSESSTEGKNKVSELMSTLEKSNKNKSSQSETSSLAQKILRNNKYVMLYTFIDLITV